MVPMRFKPTRGTKKGIPYPGGIVGAMQEDHNGGYVKYMDYEYKADKLINLLIKARDSVVEELNELMNNRVFQRSSEKRKTELEQLLIDIEKEVRP